MRFRRFLSPLSLPRLGNRPYPKCCLYYRKGLRTDSPPVTSTTPAPSPRSAPPPVLGSELRAAALESPALDVPATLSAALFVPMLSCPNPGTLPPPLRTARLRMASLSPDPAPGC